MFLFGAFLCFFDNIYLAFLYTGWPTKMSLFFFGNNFYKNKKTFKIFSRQLLEVYRILLVETTLESIMCYYTFSVINTMFIQQLKHKNCPHLYGAFIVESIWFLFWWCPLLSVDCLRKRCLTGTPSGNSQAGWDLGNRMARGYQSDAKRVSPMGSYTWGIQVFCSRNEAPPQKSWRFTYFCKSYCQRKIGIFLWATLYI